MFSADILIFIIEAVNCGVFFFLSLSFSWLSRPRSHDLLQLELASMNSPGRSLWMSWSSLLGFQH